VQEYPLTFSIY